MPAAFALINTFGTMLSCPFFILQEMSPATLRMQSSVGSHPKGPVTLFYCHSYDYCLTLDPIHRNEMKKSFHLDKLSADLSFFSPERPGKDAMISGSSRNSFWV